MLPVIQPGNARRISLSPPQAHAKRLFHKFASGNLLDKGKLELRTRELIIHRITAQCGSEYEWGVHAAFFCSKSQF
ncbi:MAG: carboxymuconolactone decarboxylase family protein [Oceanospirillaceae bacterium]|nr:carboxymuconolactone decarboxylase family protein [Oceanospirillaceae bacterium]MCP5335810.1 carboxymuconolactone decarboxylase family protein [Oceanospirillaceae bacterium]MCP5349887.1 carboxymuconolactone decarboxylase family protein [Oceanospirillaceae bacterium]